MLKISLSLVALSFLFTACHDSAQSSYSSADASAPMTFTISSAVHENVPFESNRGYLALNVAALPVKKVLEDLKRETGLRLSNRGEAHVTVLTPAEYSAVASVIGGSGIEAVAEKANIQESAFETVCVGKGSARVGSKTESTFFIVVKSPDLLNLRQAILDEYHALGGDGQPLEPAHYYPHITIGFTKTDLHEEQGVIKDESSCAAELTETP